MRSARALVSLSILLSGTFIVLLCYRPSGDDDFWWTLKIGDYVRAERDVPRTALWTIDAIRDLPYVCHSWLSALVFSTVVRAFGLDAAMLVPVLVAMLVFAGLIALARRLGAPWLLGVAIAELLLWPITRRMVCRAEVFGALYFTASLYLLAAYHRTGRIRHLAALVAVAVVWVNSHASFLILFALIPLVAAGRLLDAWRRAGYRREALAACAFSRSTAALLATFMLVCAASLVNPYGIDLLHRILEPSRANSFMRDIAEWRPLPAFGWPPAVFAFPPVLLLAAVGFGFRRLSWVSLLLAPFLCALELLAVRNITVAGIGTAFVLGDFAAGIELGRRARVALPAALAAALLAGNALFAHDLGFAGRSIATHPSRFMSAAGLAFIRQNVRGNVLNQYELGGLLIYFGYPQIRVAMDSRADPYPPAYYRSFHTALHGPAAATRAFVERYAIDHVIVRRVVYDDSLRAKLPAPALPEFWLAYEDALVVVLSRRDILSSGFERSSIPKVSSLSQR